MQKIIVLLCFSLSACVYIKETENGSIMTEKKISWYFRYTAIDYRGRPYLLYKIDANSSQMHYVDSFSHVFPLLKYEKQRAFFYDPVSLSEKLNSLGYKTSIEKVNDLVVYSKPEDPNVLGVKLKQSGKDAGESRIGYKVSALCLKYEIPDIFPPRYDKHCYVSSSAIRKAGLMIETW